MTAKLMIMAGLAVAFGATSYVGGNYYLESQADALTQARLNELESNRTVVQEVELAKVVVANEELKFGQLLEPGMLKVIDWPQNAYPEGAFSSVEEMLKDGGRRVLDGMSVGEPILLGKVSGNGANGGLAGVIAEGMRAVTIPVDTINGVGGFILPGDRVDIILTREQRVELANERSRTETASKIILENVKVLSVDQEAGDRSNTAVLANSVTLETDAKGAQRIALALNIGSLSLLLRSAGDTSSADAGGVNASNIDGDDTDSFLSFEEEKPTTTSVTVIAGRAITNYVVDIENVENQPVRADGAAGRVISSKPNPAFVPPEAEPGEDEKVEEKVSE